MYTPFRASDAVLEGLRREEEAKRAALYESGDIALQAHKDNEKDKNLYSAREIREANERAYSDFENEVKTEFLAEAIYHLYNGAIDISESNQVATENIKKNYVFQFIKESGGARKLLREFKYASNLLSEYALIIEKSCNKAMKSVKEEDKDTFKVDAEIKSDFVDAIKAKDTDDVSELIQGRVVDAVNKFVEKNAADKEEIEQITTDAQEKIDATSPEKEKLQESYRTEAARKISEITSRKSTSIFEAMVRSIAKGAVKEDNLNEVFVGEGGKIDFDLVMESAIIMYTFFETVNTTKMVKVDEEYIKEVYNSLS